jgi:hypothetical protein
MESHFEHALNYFAKYDRHTKEKSSLHPYQAESLDLQTNETTLLIHQLLPPKKNFKDLVPQIKLELEKNIDKKSNLVEIKKQSYVKTFIVIYLGILKYSIDVFVNKNIGIIDDCNETIGYTLNVDALLFDKALKGSYSSMKELSIASAFAKD